MGDGMQYQMQRNGGDEDKETFRTDYFISGDQQHENTPKFPSFGVD